MKSSTKSDSMGKLQGKWRFLSAVQAVSLENKSMGHDRFAAAHRFIVRCFYGKRARETIFIFKSRVRTLCGTLSVECKYFVLCDSVAGNSLRYMEPPRS